MRDREIVAAIVAGNPDGLAAAYDNYASVLYNYCRSLLAEPADAADAVQDTFVIAAAKVDGLRDPDRLRPWLYAVARNECHRRLRARARFASLDEAGDVSDSAAPEPDHADAAVLKELVTAAVAGLNSGDRDVIELNLRHELTGGDLADALGVEPNHAHALASRARSQLERSLGALLVARTGRKYCAELDAILAGWDGKLTILLRKRISRHVENCDKCAERKRREMSPAMLLSVLPIFALPRGLRQHVLRLVSDSSPEAANYRDAVLRRAGKFGSSGFPLQRSAVGGHGGWPHSQAATFAAAAVLIIALGGGTAAYLLGHHHHDNRHASPPVTVTITAPPSPAIVPAVRTSAPTVSPSAAFSSVQTLPSTSAPPSAPPAHPSHAPPPGTLRVSPTAIKLTQSPAGVAYTGSFTVAAAGGPVSYSISVPAGEVYLSLSALTGTVKAGETRVISVTVIPSPTGPPPAYYNTITINPGAISVVVYYPPSG